MAKIKTNKRYAVIESILLLITAYMIIKMKNIIWDKFFLCILIGTIFGETWQTYISYADQSWPGWWYAPGKVFGYIGKVSFEDILFYPICGTFFICIKELIPKFEFKYNEKLNYFAIVFILIFTWLVMLISSMGGVSIGLWFAIPGIILMALNLKKIDFGNFILTGLFIVVFASLWDLCIKDWIYIDHATMQHSNLWLNQSWAWIKNSPLEITPWFSIAGWIFIYNLSEIMNIKKESANYGYNRIF
jgi:hypothetical protein